MSRALLVSAFLAVLLGGVRAADKPNDWITPGAVPATESIVLANGVCEAVVLVKPFVRLSSFRLRGGRNHLVDFSSPNPVEKGRLLRPLYVIGARLWPTPEVAGWYKFGLVPGTAERHARQVDVSLGPDPVTGLAGRIRFALDAELPRLEVSSVLRNASAGEVRTGCWWPVAFEPGGTMESSISPGSSPPPSPDPACRIDGRRVTLDLDGPLRGDLCRYGFPGREIAVVKPDCIYRVAALDPVPGPGAAYPGDGSSAVLYRDQRTWFCEAELVGPLARLAPGEEAAFRWSLTVEPRR